MITRDNFFDNEEAYQLVELVKKSPKQAESFIENMDLRNLAKDYFTKKDVPDDQILKRRNWVESFSTDREMNFRINTVNELLIKHLEIQKKAPKNPLGPLDEIKNEIKNEDPEVLLVINKKPIRFPLSSLNEKGETIKNLFSGVKSEKDAKSEKTVLKLDEDLSFLGKEFRNESLELFIELLRRNDV